MMSRIVPLQQWYNLSDLGAEEALYDIQSMRAFCNLEPDAIRFRTRRSILTFRHCSKRMN